ncbi:MAG: hypothetical protein ACTSRZ_20630 [Promethearchaeota archaeon]
MRSSGVLKVYNEAEKIFNLNNSKIGILTYGMALLGKRTIESYIREFEIENEPSITNNSIEKICEDLNRFFSRKYTEIITPDIENIFDKPFNKIPDEKKPTIGLVVGGFSPNEPLSEIYNVIIPSNKIIRLREKGNFGSNWFGVIDPIRRLIKGFDVNLLNKIIEYFVSNFNIEFSEKINNDINKIIRDYEYKIPYNAMPLQEGIDHVKFLLDIVINNYKFVIGAPICGGNIRIAIITRDGYKKITENELRIK